MAWGALTVRDIALSQKLTRSFTAPHHRLFRKVKAEKATLRTYYDLEEQLGAGNFAAVYRANVRSTTPGQASVRTYEADGRLLPVPKEVAVKCIDRKSASMEDIMREIEVTRLISHPVKGAQSSPSYLMIAPVTVSLFSR